MSIPKKEKKKSLLKTSDINKEKELKVALTKGRDIGPYFDQKLAREIYQDFRRGGMPPKSAQRSMLRMLKKMSRDEIEEHRYGDRDR